MKTKTVIILTFAATLVLAACSKEDDVQKGERVVYEENFDGNSGWSHITGATYQVSETGGKLIQKRTEDDGTYYYAYAQKQFTGTEKKQIVEFTFRLTAGTGSVVVIFNAGNSQESTFYMSENQYFKINRYTYSSGTAEEVVEWKESSLINITQTSVLRIELQNGTVNFMLNGKKLYQWDNSGITNLDQFGLGVTMWDGDSPTTVELDKVRAIAVE